MLISKESHCICRLYHNINHPYSLLYSILFPSSSSSLCYLHPSSLICVPSENRVDFNVVGGEVLCASEGVISFLSGIDVVCWEAGVAAVVLVRVGMNDDIISTSKHWTIC